MSIIVRVSARKDGRWDIYVADDNGHQLLNSSQGYENRSDAVRVVRRLFGTVHLTGKAQEVYLDEEDADGASERVRIR